MLKEGGIPGKCSGSGTRDAGGREAVAEDAAGPDATPLLQPLAFPPAP